MKNSNFVNKIICADALKLLPQLEAGSIDIVLTDPPYFLDKAQKPTEHTYLNNMVEPKILT